MKAEESKVIEYDIQVGDLVYNPYHDKVQRVISRNEYDEILLEGETRYRKRDFEPIPITPEILEKNGFTHDFLRWDGRDTYALFTKEHFVINIDKSKEEGRYYIYAENLDTGKEVVIHNAMYVHELQHALRLCEINKEIVL